MAITLELMTVLVSIPTTFKMTSVCRSSRALVQGSDEYVFLSAYSQATDDILTLQGTTSPVIAYAGPGPASAYQGVMWRHYF